MEKNEYDFFSKKSEKTEEQEEDLKKEPVKKVQPPINKPKTKHTVVGVSGAFIYTSYIVDGVTCGARIEREEKYKNTKPGDVILL